MDEHEQQALADIDEFGCHVLHVLEEGDEPPFSYSIGIQKTSGAPEVVVIGLKEPIAHFVVNEYNRRVRTGERFEPGTKYDGFLEGFPVQVVVVAQKHFREYFGWNRWLYRGDGFKVLQLIYPTTEGIWPWDETASDWFRQRQPDLSR